MTLFRIAIAAAAACAALAAAPVAQAGMYDQPYALLESGAYSEVHKEAPVGLTVIDGKSTRNARKSDPIAPGPHQVTVRFTSARGVFRPESIDIQIDAEPCTLYRVVAVWENKTGGDWKPRVYSEPIVECVKKFKTTEKK